MECFLFLKTIDMYFSIAWDGVLFFNCQSILGIFCESLLLLKKAVSFLGHILVGRLAHLSLTIFPGVRYSVSARKTGMTTQALPSGHSRSREETHA